MRRVTTILGLSGMLFELVLRVEPASQKIGRSHSRYSIIRKNQHRYEELLGTEQLLGYRTDVAASFDRPGYLCEVQHSKIQFRIPLGKVNKRPRDGLRGGHAKAIEVIGGGRMREISVDHAFREIRAIPRDAIEMILIGGRIKLRDQRLVLLHGRIDHENVHPANE